MKTMIKETNYFYLYALHEGVYAAIAKLGQGAWSNAGIVDMGDELLIFDSLATPSAGYELKMQAEKVTGKRAKYLINSHYHGDHVFGNQAFTDTTIVSTSSTRKWFIEKNKIEDVSKEKEEMKEYLKKLKKQIKVSQDRAIKESLTNQFNEMSNVLKDLPHLKMVLPSVTFDEKLVIEGSKRKVELYCYGGGHTPSDTFMYLPEEKIGFMGDLVTVDLHLPIYDPVIFSAILEKVKSLDIDLIVPGHGSPGNKELLYTLDNYLTFLKEKTTEALKVGVTLEDLVSTLEIPNEYSEWKGVNGSKGNLATVYGYYKDTTNRAH